MSFVSDNYVIYPLTSSVPRIQGNWSEPPSRPVFVPVEHQCQRSVVQRSCFHDLGTAIIFSKEASTASTILLYVRSTSIGSPILFAHTRNIYCSLRIDKVEEALLPSPLRHLNSGWSPKAFHGCSPNQQNTWSIQYNIIQSNARSIRTFCQPSRPISDSKARWYLYWRSGSSPELILCVKPQPFVSDSHATPTSKHTMGISFNFWRGKRSSASIGRGGVHGSFRCGRFNCFK